MNNNRKRSLPPGILSKTVNSDSDPIRVTIRVDDPATADRLAESSDFQDLIKSYGDGQSLPFWEITSPTGEVYRRSPLIGPLQAQAIVEEFSTTRGEVVTLMTEIVQNIAPHIASDLARVLATHPGSSDQLARMLEFCLGESLPSVITYHPGATPRRTDDCFFLANHINSSIEGLTISDLRNNPNFTQPLVINGCVFSPHWSYQPDRRIDLIRELDQSGEHPDFVYQWVNPLGQVVEGCLDYKLFAFGDLLFRVSRHKDLRIVKPVLQ